MWKVLQFTRSPPHQSEFTHSPPRKTHTQTYWHTNQTRFWPGEDMHCLLQATKWNYNQIPIRYSSRTELWLFQHRTPAVCYIWAEQKHAAEHKVKNHRLIFGFHFFSDDYYAASSNCTLDFVVKIWIRHKAQTQVLMPWPISNPRFSFTSEHICNIFISANQHSKNEAPPLIPWIRIKTSFQLWCKVTWWWGLSKVTWWCSAFIEPTHPCNPSPHSHQEQKTKQETQSQSINNN